MIQGMHGLIYSDRADELRAFFRDKLALPCKDVGGGWLIFDLPTCDLGVHPTDGSPSAGTHAISFFCDEIEATVAELEQRGVEIIGGIEDTGWGLVTHVAAPGGLRIQIYQPKYK